MDNADYAMLHAVLFAIQMTLVVCLFAMLFRLKRPKQIRMAIRFCPREIFLPRPHTCIRCQHLAENPHFGIISGNFVPIAFCAVCDDCQQMLAKGQYNEFWGTLVSNLTGCKTVS